MESIPLRVCFTREGADKINDMMFCGIPRIGDAVVTDKGRYIVRRIIHVSSSLPIPIAPPPHLEVLLEPVATLDGDQTPAPTDSSRRGP